LKHQVDNANLSTVCDKRELEIPMHGSTINLFQAAASVVGDWWRDRINEARQE
jgi:tRNA(Leu) C34 or U34 (ribose-2'-O)-methylase TrmL